MYIYIRVSYITKQLPNILNYRYPYNIYIFNSPTKYTSYTGWRTLYVAYYSIYTMYDVQRILFGVQYNSFISVYTRTIIEHIDNLRVLFTNIFTTMYSIHVRFIDNLRTILVQFTYNSRTIYIQFTYNLHTILVQITDYFNII